ncbi:MAG: hypothetical protein IJY09_04890 [Lachnospiraceae bacterium]|nr:hypothetical protein [Lachnospiraceae bacterium]
MTKAVGLLDAIGEIRDDFVLDAAGETAEEERKPVDEKPETISLSEKRKGKRKLRGWQKASVAAAVCAMLVGGGLAGKYIGSGNSQSLPFGSDSNRIQQWAEDFAAGDYFVNSKITREDVLVRAEDKSALRAPYYETRYFSDERELLEQEGRIPVIETHPLFDAAVHFNEDGSLHSLQMSWHCRDDMESYSDIGIKAGYQEIEEISDCIFIELDERGNIVTPRVTVTERDGVRIVAEGNENRDKTMTYQTESGWYQISGSWNDSYETVVSLFEWFWAHPLDLERFLSGGDTMEYISCEAYPEAFAAYIPDFAALGYEVQEEHISLKNGEAVYFGGSYVKNGSGYVSWYLNAEPDYYERRDSLGALPELTREQVIAAFSEDGSRGFFWDEYYGAIYLGAGVDAEDAWQIIQWAQTMSK